MGAKSIIGKELIGRLDINRPKLTAWIREGLPVEQTSRGPRFDPEAVKAWLIDKGHAKQVTPPNLVGTKAEVARHFGVSERTVSTWLNDGCPGEPAGPGRRGQYDLTTIAAWRDLRTAQAGDELMAGPTSPALERYRAARAGLAELDLLERNGTLLDRQKAHEAHARMARILQTLGENLQRHHGPAAQQLLNEALDDYQREANNLCAP